MFVMQRSRAGELHRALRHRHARRRIENPQSRAQAIVSSNDCSGVYVRRSGAAGDYRRIESCLGENIRQGRSCGAPRAEAINAAEQDAENEHRQSRLHRSDQLTYLRRPDRCPGHLPNCPFNYPHSGTARLWARLPISIPRQDPFFSVTYQNICLAQHLHTSTWSFGWNGAARREARFSARFDRQSSRPIHRRRRR